jgi:muramoyltetrapeptide carboxypeptidase
MGRASAGSPHEEAAGDRATAVDRQGEVADVDPLVVPVHERGTATASSWAPAGIAGRPTAAPRRRGGARGSGARAAGDNPAPPGRAGVRGSGRMRLKPPALPDRATIAVIAPASPPQTRSEIEQAAAYFEARGHTVVFGPNHRKVHGYLAGTDEERAADLRWALGEPGIDMVHALCGGYGCARLHDLVDWSAVGDPRIVCGFSDITALHLALARHAGWVTLYGPNFLRFVRKKDELTPETEAWFHRALQPEPLGRVFEDPEDPYVLTVCGGVADGPVAGGCLTLLCASIGTPFEVETDGCIVMVEDLNTDPYLIDTGLTHLLRAGKLDRAAGFVFGTAVNLGPQTLPTGPESTLSIEEILDELIAPLGIPAVANVPTGHGKHMATLPLGVRARLDAGAKTLDILEPAVA